MSIGADRFAYIAQLVKKHAISTRSCLLLGAPDFSFGFSTLVGIATGCGLLEMKSGKLLLAPDHPLNRVVNAGGHLALDSQGRPTDRVTDRAAFAALGFESVDSLQFPGGGAATLPYDLNEPGMPAAIDRRYDLILDEGMMERVFHFPNMLENVIGILNVAGCILHANAMNNSVEQGFYQFTPTFHSDFYAVNGFEIIDAVVAEIQANGGKLTFFQRYERRATDLHDNRYEGVLDGRRLEFWFTARKQATSSGNRIPQQFLFDNADLTGHPALAGGEKIVVWGAGLAATTILARRIDVSRIAYFIDADPRKVGTACLGLPVKSPHSLREQHGCVVLIGSVTHEHAIRYQISQEFNDHVARVVTLGELLVDSPAYLANA